MRFNPKEIGFEFSVADVEAYWNAVDREKTIAKGKFYSQKKAA